MRIACRGADTMHGVTWNGSYVFFFGVFVYLDVLLQAVSPSPRRVIDAGMGCTTRTEILEYVIVGTLCRNPWAFVHHHAA